MWYYTILLTAFAGGLASNVIYYDTYKGTKISKEEYQSRKLANNTYWCTGSYRPCNVDEARRLDGSCNNLKCPTRGTPHTPFLRELPEVYDEDFQPRKAKSGNSLPLARRLRTGLLQVGDTINKDLTIMVAHYMLFYLGDVASNHDTANYVLWNKQCCQPKGKDDYECAPQIIPNNDYVHQFSNIRCFNLTRPLTFQSTGCLGKNVKGGDRIASESVFFDMSNVYAYNSTAFRTYEDGLIITEIENDKIWPASTKSQETCVLNKFPKEKRCNRNDKFNVLFGTTFTSTLFWRYHNFIATELKKMNPNWKDKQLFEMAKDINIACMNQIYYYELMPILMGKQNMIKCNLISASEEHREMYNESMIPQSSLEYSYVLRYIHTIQPGSLNMYDTDGFYLNQIPVVNLTQRPGYLPNNNHMEKLTQGCFRQPAAKIDTTVDPILSEQALMFLQRAFDVFTADIAKGRYFGFPPYYKYRELCCNKTYTCWEDLAQDIDEDKLELLKQNYEDFEDVELMTGIYMERPLEGSIIPRTLQCLLEKQLLRNIQFDRFWYERKNRPNAFTIKQLQTIRKVTMAQIFCTVGDSVCEIQPNVFMLPNPKNKMDSCEKIANIDFSAWKDERYNSEEYY